MRHKYLFVIGMLAVIFFAAAGMTIGYVHHQEKAKEQSGLTVVTSFYPMYIAAENIIGDCEGVKLENLSEPQTGCLHDYQLTAADMKLLSTADVFIINGGGIETFLAEVAQSYPDLTIINASEHLDLLGDNAHAWMSPKDYAEQISAIRDGLIAADAEHEEIYRKNTSAYAEKVQALIYEAQELTRKMQGKSVVLLHEAYAYTAREYGAHVAGVLNLDEERQVSAGEVADVLRAIRSEHVNIVLAEELYGKDMGNTLKAETGINVVYLDTLVRGDYASDSYLVGMEKNIQLLKEAFSQTGGSE